MRLLGNILAFDPLPLLLRFIPRPAPTQWVLMEPQTTVNHSDSFAAFCRQHGDGSNEASEQLTAWRNMRAPRPCPSRRVKRRLTARCESGSKRITNSICSGC